MVYPVTCPTHLPKHLIKYTEMCGVVAVFGTVDKKHRYARNLCITSILKKSWKTPSRTTGSHTPHHIHTHTIYSVFPSLSQTETFSPGWQKPHCFLESPTKGWNTILLLHHFSFYLPHHTKGGPQTICLNILVINSTNTIK